MLEINYPNWYLLVCLLVGGLIAGLLYYRDNRSGFSKPVVWGLALMRALVVSAICALLLEPLIRYTSYESEEPVLILGIDNSQSMKNHADSLTLAQSVETWVKEVSERLDGKYQVKAFTFGEETQTFDTLSFQESETNLSGFLEELNALYSFRNVAGVTLITDGIYNQGSNPEYVKNRIKAPIYVLETGDTSKSADLKITDARYNEIAFLGDRFPLEFDVVAEGLKGKRAKVTLSSGGQVLDQQPWDLGGGHVFKTFRYEVEAQREGVQQFTLTIEPLKGERTVRNNRMNLYVKVLDARQKILLVYAFTHPDVGAIRRTLENNENYEVELLPVNDLSSMDMDGLEKNYNLAILYQAPALKGKLQAFNSFMQTRLPKMFIVGPRTNIGFLNQHNIGVKWSGFNGQYGEARAGLNAGFTLFDLNSRERAVFDILPPLTVPFGEAKPMGNYESFLQQQIGLVKTEYPLWIFSTLNGQKTGVLAGEGIWRWPLAEFEQNGNTEVFNKIWDRSTAYLASKDLNRPFRVRAARSFKATEPVLLYGELYNQAFERVNDPEATVVLKNQEGEEYSWQMARSQGKYLLEVGTLEPGSYSYEAKVSFGGKELSDKGEFTVTETYLEFAEYRTNHQLLTNLTQQSGGALYTLEQANEWLTKMEQEIAEPVVFEENTYLDLVHLKWIFALLLTLLSLEWFFRKREGVI
ncbi:hypothetical protein KFE98_21485 [bacterium SCSIO 12741]|nr:hypothetical protein KFE98_21485 [bacterium SCSIO 12741]